MVELLELYSSTVAVDHSQSAKRGKQAKKVETMYLFAEALAKQKPEPDQDRALLVLLDDVIPQSPTKHLECEAGGDGC